MVFRALPYDEPDRLVRIDLFNPNFTDSWPSGFPSGLSGSQYLSWKQHTDVFEEMAAAREWGGVDVSSAGHPLGQLSSGFASAGLFSMFGVEPILGRGFLPDDERLGSEDVVILSHSAWLRLFGGEATAIGQTLWVSGMPGRGEVEETGGAATIIGVLPAGFNPPGATAWTEMGGGPSETELWRPLRLAPAADQTDTEIVQASGGTWLVVTARLGPDIALEQAQAVVNTLFTPPRGRTRVAGGSAIPA